jgi:putative selenate reductase
LRVKRARARRTERHEPEILPVDRRAGFDLVDRTLSESAARDEAARCLQCSTLCEKCVEVCPNRANYAYQVSPVSLSLPRLRCEEGRLVTAGREPFRVAQARQILHVHDLCNECGNCATFCVHRGRPYEDKPRLFLRHGDYLAQQDNAFYIAGNTIQQREGGQDSRLMANGGILTFWNAWVQVRLSPALEVLDMELREPFEETLSLRGAAEMAMILRGVSDALPFLRTPLPGAQVA